MNDSLSYSELRQHLKTYLDKVCNEHQPLLVTRARGDDVVILARSDYEALEETAYLLRSPANAKRLITALMRPEGARIAFSSLKALRDETGI